jgi:electron transfer flavoprotein alpha subunit
MGNDIMVFAEHLGGQLNEATFELIGKARELAGATGGKVSVALLGAADLASELGGADTIYSINDPSLAGYNPDSYEKALVALVEEHSPRLVMFANTTPGLDLAPAVSAATGSPLAAYCVGLAAEGSTLVATCQIYGGKLLAEVAIDAPSAVVTCLAGAFPADAGRSGGAGEVVNVDSPAALAGSRSKFLELSQPEASDVDITAADMLVSVGRGIGSQDNLEVVQELADALGVPLSASRPIIDQGWLPKPRQVGKSGLKVKPKVYLMFGISGAPEHLEGMRDAELIIACNTDEKAPIFDVAHYGTTVDLFDLAPALVDAAKA